ncbi:reverse transcriptase domain-containing protein [Vibrio lentus]
MKKINNDFFKKAILKGNTSLYDNFEPTILERKVGCDTFFTISDNTPHYRINKRITNIVLSQIEINSSACGFVQKKSYYDFLKPHIHGYYYLRLDIKKFFHSISITEVKSLIESCFSKEKGDAKYSPSDIALMAVTHKASNECPDEELKGKEILPIGLPSSPVISNIIFRRIDILIQKYCEDKKITYSRYADDLLFSSLDSKFIHSEHFEKEISIFISTLSLRLNKKKRKACENTISLNGYVIQNTKPKKFSFSNVYKENSVGTIRLSNKKIKVLKKLTAYLKKGLPAHFIMEKLFGLNPYKFKNTYGNDIIFYKKYSKDQLQNKLKGYRSYLVALIKFDNKNNCVDKSNIKSLKSIIAVIDKNII